MSSFSSIPILIQTTQPKLDVLVHISLPEPLKHPDVIWFNPDGAPLTIESVRTLQQNVLTSPYQANQRVFILQAIDLATTESQQALLKILEEPPKHIIFILTSEYPSMILPTILSRVKVIVNREVSDMNAEEDLENLESKSIAEKLEWASKQAGDDHPTRVALKLLSHQIIQMEELPTAGNIQKVKLLEKMIEMIRAKTNPKLCFEWLALHI